MEDNKNNIFQYLLFLRITPIIPSWFNNLAAPIIGIKYKIFFWASLLGTIPGNMIYVNMGYELSSLEEMKFDFRIFIMLFLLGVMIFIPRIIAKIMNIKIRIEEKQD